MEELRETELTASERYYQNHLNRMREYSKKNKELINERNRQHYARMIEDKEKHDKYLEKRREAYKNRVVDPEKKELISQKKREQYKKRNEVKET